MSPKLQTVIASTQNTKPSFVTVSPSRLVNEKEPFFSVSLLATKSASAVCARSKNATKTVTALAHAIKKTGSRSSISTATHHDKSFAIHRKCDNDSYSARDRTFKTLGVNAGPRNGESEKAPDAE